METKKHQFIALTLEPRVQQYLKDIQSKWDVKKFGKVNLVQPENMHVSLAFLKDADDMLLSDATHPLNKLASLISPINVSISETGMFPHANDPKVIWAGLNGELDKLAEVKRLVDGILEKIEFDIDKRRFVPHITLGRVKYLKKPTHRLALSIMDTEMFPIQFQLSEIAWIESTLTPQGPNYKTLKTFPLTGEDTDGTESE